MPGPDEEEDFEALLAEYEEKSPAPQGRGPKVGDVVQGAVVSIGHDSVFVELGSATW